MKQRLGEEFTRRYGAPPSFWVRAPGRVNLIGEHTDYNDGLVLPMAIDRWLWLAAAPRDDRRVELESFDLPGRASFSLDAPTVEGQGWGVYVSAVAAVLAERRAPVRGFDGIIASEIPAGAGLSSSAALELAAARALSHAGAASWEAETMALLCHRAETERVGVECGVMDQLICATGREGHASMIDCRSLDSTPIAIPGQLAVVVLDTNTRRSLHGSSFNERRMESASAARALGQASLRDVDEQMLTSIALGDVLRRRARHVVTENARVLEFSEALARSRHAAIGQLMADSHASLRDDYEVSTAQLDAIVSAAVAAPGCVGARMTGAGFGGCAVALVERKSTDEFATAVEARYAESTGLKARVLVCRPVAGVEVVS